MVSPKVFVKHLTFSDGSTVSLNHNDITVIVGPNNSGKSEVLRNIKRRSYAYASDCPVLTNIGLEKHGSSEELNEWLCNVSSTNNSVDNTTSCSYFGCQIELGRAKHLWDNGNNGLSDLAGIFVYHLNTEERLRAANTVSSIAILHEPLTHPIHHLYANDQLELQISSHFKRAFGMDLIVHRTAGSVIPLFCGERPYPNAGEDRVSRSYTQAIEALPNLQTQGDGMRAFVGVLLHSLVVKHNVLLIDEPEAFLHPPQARYLGRLLATEIPSDRQLFIATHSGDFLRGILDANSSRVRILRIERNGTINLINELDQEGVSTVWNDTLLRHSNVLDGVFHSKVILCESDSDCQFYSAVLDSLYEINEGKVRKDIMFTHCGGKDRMPITIKSLRKLGVPIIAVANIDILNRENTLRAVFTELGGDWSTIQHYWSIVFKAILSMKAELRTSDVIREINDIISQVSSEAFPEEKADEIRNILKRISPWSHVKNSGKDFIPSGEPTQAFTSLSSSLRECGLFLVECGEVERFVKSVGGHGPKWVTAVLSKDFRNDMEFEAARQFVEAFTN